MAKKVKFYLKILFFLNRNFGELIAYKKFTKNQVKNRDDIQNFLESDFFVIFLKNRKNRSVWFLFGSQLALNGIMVDDKKGARHVQSKTSTASSKNEGKLLLGPRTSGGFLSPGSIFNQNLDLWPKFRFLTKIFDQNFDFWPKFRFLT